MERSEPLTSGCQGWKAVIRAAGQVIRVKPNGMRAEACRRPGRRVITGARSLQGRPLCCVKACFPAAACPPRPAVPAAGGARHVCATSVLRFGKLKRLCGREDRPGGTKKNLRAGHTLQGTHSRSLPFPALQQRANCIVRRGKAALSRCERQKAPCGSLQACRRGLAA